jgi:tight adherence protein C
MSWLGEIGNWLSASQYDPERLRLLFVALIGLAGFTIALTFSFLVGAMVNPLRRRIRAVEDAKQREQSPAGAQLLQSLGSTLVPKADDKRSKVQLELERAGFRGPSALKLFFGAKLVGFVVAPVVVLTSVTALSQASLFNWLSVAVFSGIVALFLPDLWLRRKVRARQRLLRQGLPDALDLMVVCTEAGLGLSSALKRVADEIGVQHLELADELQLVIMQTRAGMDNRSALKELERRTGLDDIGAFVTTLLQAMRFGTSIGEALRVFSEDMRDKRLQRAQEKAARLSLLMLMPIAICMLPMFMIIAIGPSMLVLMRALSSITAGTGG